VLANAEHASTVAEELIRLLDKLGESSTSQVVRIGARMLRPVAEEVCLGGVTVEIEVVLKVSAAELFQTFYELVESLDFGIYSPVGIQELPIEVLPAVARTKISQYYSVGIHHRHHSKFVSF